ncbi:MAG: hypothetical protein LBF78_05895 [Treponema sp.]|jgi:hypothetical protein|nr:hypothetical protein [Treponema sp.]
MKKKIVALLLLFAICGSTAFAVDGYCVGMGLAFGIGGGILFIPMSDSEVVNKGSAIIGGLLMIPAGILLLVGLLIPGDNVAMVEDPVLKNVSLEFGPSNVFMGYTFHY